MDQSSQIRTVCVYCGSGGGTSPAFVASAKAFGKVLADNGITLIYGGGNIGMMGTVSAAVMENGGKVVGIIPEFLLTKERAGRHGADNLIVTRDMHERKQKMFEMSDAFVAMPGGVGTLEEIVEQMTWAQLGRHKKPILLANIEDFWQPLCALLDHMRALEFIRGDFNFNLLVADEVEDILPTLQAAAAETPESAKDMKAVEPEKL
ncbi:MAG: TIGR00730 family Rossman fold protein [Pseudolabrys sp.]|nr:TIGR00730 family Rossman fold protein [Pseudolabrys sp.]